MTITGTAAMHRAARRRVRITPQALALLIVVAGLLLAMSYPLRQYVAERNRLAQMEQKVAALEERNAELREEIRKLHDPAYIERVARRCLGMVRPGEIAFVTVPKGGTAKPPPC